MIAPPVWIDASVELPEFPNELTNTVPCIVCDEIGSVFRAEFKRYRWAFTREGRIPRWEWHGRRLTWAVVGWLPEPIMPKKAPQ